LVGGERRGGSKERLLTFNTLSLDHASSCVQRRAQIVLGVRARGRGAAREETNRTKRRQTETKRNETKRAKTKAHAGDGDVSGVGPLFRLHSACPYPVQVGLSMAKQQLFSCHASQSIQDGAKQAKHVEATCPTLAQATWKSQLSTSQSTQPAKSARSANPPAQDRLGQTLHQPTTQADHATYLPTRRGNNPASQTDAGKHGREPTTKETKRCSPPTHHSFDHESTTPTTNRPTTSPICASR